MGIAFHAFPTLWHGVLHKHHWLLATLTSASSAPLPPTTFFPAWGRFQCRFCFGSLAPERVFACVLCHTGWVFDCVECHTVHVCMSRETEGTNPSLVLCCTALVLIGHWSCKRIRVAAAAAERETSELWGSHCVCEKGKAPPPDCVRAERKSESKHHLLRRARCSWSRFQISTIIFFDSPQYYFTSFTFQLDNFIMIPSFFGFFFPHSPRFFKFSVFDETGRSSSHVWKTISTIVHTHTTWLFLTLSCNPW